MPTDTIDAIQEATGQATSIVAAVATDSASIIADLKSRQAGLSRTVDKQLRERQDLENQITRLSEERETEAARLRNEASESKRLADQYKKDWDAAVLEKETTKRQLDVLNQQAQTRAQVAQSHPSLLGVLDDLKSRGEFADDAAYTIYLTRMQDTLFKSGPGYNVGSTPSVIRPATTPNTGTQRTVIEIQNDLWDPTKQALVPQLEAELESAMKRR